jgi:hypothetical protein
MSLDTLDTPSYPQEVWRGVEHLSTPLTRGYWRGDEKWNSGDKAEEK